MATYYWGLFYEVGFRQTFRVFSLQIDTGNHSTIFFKPPRYGPHDYEAMRNIVESLDENVVM